MCVEKAYLMVSELRNQGEEYKEAKGLIGLQGFYALFSSSGCGTSHILHNESTYSMYLSQNSVVLIKSKTFHLYDSSIKHSVILLQI